MGLRKWSGFWLFAGFLALAAASCTLFESDGRPRNAAVAAVTANTSLEPWLAAAAQAFNEAGLETADGRPAFVELGFADAGQAVADIVAGELAPDLWIPEDAVWGRVLAEQGHGGYTADCQSIASSPLVIAMWRPVAEALGWPSLPLGWLDIGSLAADPSSWSYYSGGEFGESLRLGHTHPGLSGSGASTLLAIVQAAESKREAVTAEDIAQPIVQASVAAFEAPVAWFSSNTDDLAATMGERGPSYLGAAVMYESSVVHYGNGDIVPVYPLEGTFVASHPACVSGSAESDAAAAARLFRDYLLSEESQQQAVSTGLRPANPAVPAAAPLDAAHAVDLNQPEIVFAEPSVEALYAVQDLWQAARKRVNLVMLIDVSGSMEGEKIANVRDAAAEFVQQMGEDDYLTIVAFSHELNVIADYEPVGPARPQIVEAIERLDAFGDTALYDAIGMGAGLIAERTTPDTTNALVVLSDGQDTFSQQYGFNQRLVDLAADNDTAVFVIAYGEDADRDVLSQIALGANGNFYLGDEASIAAIYEEMSAAFGGSVGVGR
jgi:Ca-activated chloride channel family protein